MRCRSPIRAAVLVGALAAPAGWPPAAAETLPPCGWQSDEIPGALAEDGEISVDPLAPAAVRLQFERVSGPPGAGYCGGAVLSAHWVLTARHCVAGKVWRDFRVEAGSSVLNVDGQGVERHVVAAYCPQRNSREALAADVALLRLETPLPPGVPVARLETLSGSSGMKPPFAGNIASWPVRYRNTEPQPVVNTPFEVIRRNESGFLVARPAVPGRLPPCSGESGSALWVQTGRGPVLRGILSAVAAGNSAKTVREVCRAPEMVALLTDVARYYAWIVETMELCDSTLGVCPPRP
ncbi:MAG: trypsin-like serine protease [Paracoccaceae bacterium]